MRFSQLVHVGGGQPQFEQQRVGVLTSAGRVTAHTQSLASQGEGQQRSFGRLARSGPIGQHHIGQGGCFAQALFQFPIDALVALAQAGLALASTALVVLALMPSTPVAAIFAVAFVSSGRPGGAEARKTDRKG